jgi:hypothetical protein
MIAVALRNDLGRTHAAAKTVMQWTGASERTVRSWFAGTKGPSSEHLMTLARHSDPVFFAFLTLSGREQPIPLRHLGELREMLLEAARSLDEVVQASG